MQASGRLSTEVKSTTPMQASGRFTHLKVRFVHIIEKGYCNCEM
jgi:hypothetical protein